MRFPIEFDLPARLIAQEPFAERDQSRLMVVRRDAGAIEHRRFRDLPELLSAGDLLILNDTRVLPARLLGRRQTGVRWEGLYLRTLADGSWEMLCRGRLRQGETIIVAGGGWRVAGDESPPIPSPATHHPPPATFLLRLDERLGPGRWRVTPLGADRDAASLLEDYGHVPLPPYIRKGRDTPADRERYQTVFARAVGAVAAPTAGLHFTPELLRRLDERGLERAQVTLHVGLGTFLPIQVDDFTQHEMHREWGQLTESTVAAIERCRRAMAESWPWERRRFAFWNRRLRRERFGPGPARRIFSSIRRTDLPRPMS